MNDKLKKDILSIVAIVFTIWLTIKLVSQGNFGSTTNWLIIVGSALYLHFLLLPITQGRF